MKRSIDIGDAFRGTITSLATLGVAGSQNEFPWLKFLSIPNTIMPGVNLDICILTDWRETKIVQYQSIVSRGTLEGQTQEG